MALKFDLKQLGIFISINRKHWKSLLNYKKQLQEKDVSKEKINCKDKLIVEIE